MAKKINVKLILELRSAGMGRNAIATSRHISKNSVGDVFHIAGRMGISYECFILGKHTVRNGVAGISPPRREFQKC